MRRDRFYRGLPSMWDLSVAQRAQFDPPRIPVRIMRRPASAGGAADVFGLRSVAALSGEAHVLQADSQSSPQSASASDTMYALAVAVSQFSRSVARTDGAVEKPSLYSPFWYSRMASSTVAERVLMATVDGDPLWIASLPR
jgi:hypothetical protein